MFKLDFAVPIHKPGKHVEHLEQRAMLIIKYYSQYPTITVIIVEKLQFIKSVFYNCINTVQILDSQHFSFA